MPTVLGFKYATSESILNKILKKSKTMAKKRKSPSVKKNHKSVRASVRRSR